MRTFVSSIILLAFLHQTCIAQDTNIVKFLPLKVGNVWVYQCTAAGTQCGFCSKRIKVNVINSSVINGKTYFQSQVTTVLISGSCSSCGYGLLQFSELIKVDSINANILQYSSNGGCSYRPNEILLDSLKAKLYDSIRYNCQPPAQWNAYVCTDTNNMTLFGVSRPARSYSFGGFESFWGRSYVKGIGLSSAGMSSMWCNDQTQLRGCVINGIVYGDTSTIVGIQQISNEIPDVFSLSQNYPNPFNPVTKIKFSLPAVGQRHAFDLRVTVYDILGREMSTLVNEQLQPGTYEVEWDGTNYPSGVYFYKLSISDPSASSGQGYTETRKMVLIK